MALLSAQAHFSESWNDLVSIKLDAPKGIEKSDLNALIARFVKCSNRLRLFIWIANVPVAGQAKSCLAKQFLESVLERGLGLLCRASDESGGCLFIYLAIDPFKLGFGLCIAIAYYTVGGSARDRGLRRKACPGTR